MESCGDVVVKSAGKMTNCGMGTSAINQSMDFTAGRLLQESKVK